MVMDMHEAQNNEWILDMDLYTSDVEDDDNNHDKDEMVIDLDMYTSDVGDYNNHDGDNNHDGIHDGDNNHDDSHDDNSHDDDDGDDDHDDYDEILLDLDLYSSDEEDDGPLSNQMVESFQRLLYNENMEEEGKRTKCTICQLDLEAGDTIVYLPACLDKFHEDCIIRSFKFSSKCPNCRSRY